MDATIERELLSVVKDLSPREAQLVIDYAKTLQTTPLSKAARVYLELLAREGIPPAELVRAAQAVQRVEEHMAHDDEQTRLYDLEHRTEDHVLSWFRERGLNYEAMTEEQLDEVINEIVHKSRPLR